MYEAIQNPRQLIAYFFSANNEHRILTTRLITVADEYLFSGKEYLQVISANGFQML